MNKGHMAYFEKDDVLHFAISDEPEAGSVEVSPGITAELNAKGELIGIEILNASRNGVVGSTPLMARQRPPGPPSGSPRSPDPKRRPNEVCPCPMPARPHPPGRRTHPPGRRSGPGESRFDSGFVDSGTLLNPGPCPLNPKP